jgi:hypothetical protein
MASQPATQPTASKRLINIMDRDNINKVVPVISNSLYINEVLRHERKLMELAAETTSDKTPNLTANEQLTKLWSKSKDVNYPMTDGHDLARVAQYYQVDQEVPVVAKRAYLKFLNSQLLELNSEKAELVNKLRSGARFSEIVAQLGYTKSLELNDPLAKLADLPFSNYITTSYHDFLERALVKAERTPVTQYLSLDDEGKIIAPTLDENGKPADPIPNLLGTVARPVVYHLFGVENDPKSLVLSEDDYINFLVAAVTDLSAVVTNSDIQKDSEKNGLPMGLRRILSAHHLLLLGYQMQDWEFRVVFRLILQLRNSSPKPGIFMQVPPNGEVETLLNYLVRYFSPKQFDVEWKTPAAFTQELWKIWEGQ